MGAKRPNPKAKVWPKNADRRLPAIKLSKLSIDPGFDRRPAS
jgi:hypothetical protein